MRATVHAAEEYKQREVTVYTQSFELKLNDNFIENSFFEIITDGVDLHVKQLFMTLTVWQNVTYHANPQCSTNRG